MSYKLEVCANSVLSCVEAQKGGAYRVELCSGILEGGTTPSYGEISIAREMLNIKLYVIIRPRGGDFLFSDIEHEIMIRDIEMAKSVGVDGVVIGCLNADGTVDTNKCSQLIEAAGEMGVTFNRAFDKCKNPQESLEKIIELGCERVLTSGQMSKAEQGVNLIKELVDQAGSRIVVMPGSGINEDNISYIASQTGANEFHLSVRSVLKSKMMFRGGNVSIAATSVMADEFSQNVTDSNRVRLALKQLNCI